MRPSLGVLITYFNEGKLLTECLDTLRSGPDKPDEILIYDDASGDPAERYVKEEHRARILRGEKNVGPGLARNELMRASGSDFIHFQDADDLFDPRWCAALRDAIGRGETGIVLNNVSVVDPEGRKTVAPRLYDFRALFQSNDLLDFFLAEYTYILVAMTTFRRESALRVGGFLPRETLTFAEDFEFHMRLFSQDLKFRVIEDALVVKRRRPNSLSRDENVLMRPGVFTDGIKSLHLIREWLPARYHRHLPDIFCRRGAGLFRNGRLPEARTAFRLAREWGGADYHKQPRAYRLLAKTFGPEFAEWIVFFYSQLKSRRPLSCGKMSRNGN